MRGRGALLTAALCGLALVVPGAANAAAGNVYVADSDFGAGNDGAIVKLGPGGGPPSLTAFGSDNALFGNPWGMVMNRDGGLLVADYDSDKILRVSRRGVVTEFFSHPAQTGPTDLAWGPDGDLYVIDFDVPNIFRLDPDTRARTPVADNTGVPEWTNAYSIVVARDRTIYFTSGTNDVFQVTPGGAVTKFYEGPLIGVADGLALTPDERYLFVAATGPDTIVRIDRRTRAATPFASGFAGVGALAQTRDGGFLV